MQYTEPGRCTYCTCYAFLFFYYYYSLLFHRGESLQQLLPLGEQSFLLLVRQILGVPGVPRFQRDAGAPRRAQGSHGAREEGSNDRGRRSDGRNAVAVDRVGGFRGSLRREAMGEVWRHGGGGGGQRITKEATCSHCR